MHIHIYLWRFPEIGVPPNQPFLIEISLINHPFLGYPHDYGNPNIPSSKTKQQHVEFTSVDHFFSERVSP